MTDDIVARLRQTHRVGCDCVGCDAAAEIERLRAQLEATELKLREQTARSVEAAFEIRELVRALESKQ